MFHLSFERSRCGSKSVSKGSRDADVEASRLLLRAFFVRIPIEGILDGLSPHRCKHHSIVPFVGVLCQPFNPLGVCVEVLGVLVVGVPHRLPQSHQHAPASAFQSCLQFPRQPLALVVGGVPFLKGPSHDLPTAVPRDSAGTTLQVTFQTRRMAVSHTCL